MATVVEGEASESDEEIEECGSAVVVIELVLLRVGLRLSGRRYMM